MISLVSTSKLRHLNVARYSYIASSKYCLNPIATTFLEVEQTSAKSYSIVVSSKFLEASATPKCNVARSMIQRYFLF